MEKVLFLLVSICVFCGVVGYYKFAAPSNNELEIKGIEDSIYFKCDENVYDNCLEDVYLSVNGKRTDVEVTIENQGLVDRIHPDTLVYVAYYDGKVVKQARKAEYQENVITIEQIEDFIAYTGEEIEFEKYFKVNSVCACDGEFEFANVEKIDDDGHYNVTISFNEATIDTTLTVVEKEEDIEDINSSDVSQASLGNVLPIFVLNTDEAILHVGEEFKYNKYIESIEDAVDTYRYLAHFIRLESNVDTSKPGTYTVKYSVTNTRGYTGSTTLTVKVVAE